MIFQISSLYKNFHNNDSVDGGNKSSMLKRMKHEIKGTSVEKIDGKLEKSKIDNLKILS